MLGQYSSLSPLGGQSGEARLAVVIYQRAGVEVVDALEPLTIELFAQIAAHDADPLIGHLSAADLWAARSSRYRTWLAEGGLCVVAVESPGSAPVGYAMVSISPEAEDFDFSGPVAEMESLVVAPESRRIGVATGLLEQVRIELRQAGVRRMLVGALVSNVPAHTFYVAHGLRPWATQYIDTL